MNSWPEERAIHTELTLREVGDLIKPVYWLGEHMATGAPIAEPEPRFNKSVGAAYRRLPRIPSSDAGGGA